MHFYLDGSGHVNYRPPQENGDTDYYVLGGVLVTTEQRIAIESGLDALISRYFPDRDPRAVELHTSPLLAGNGPWGTIDGIRRPDFVTDVRDLLLTVRPISFAQVVHKQGYANHFSYLEVLTPERPAVNALRFVLGRAAKRVARGSQKCTLTVDGDSKEMRDSYSALIQDIRERGDKIAGLNYKPWNVTKLNDFYDPHFLDSHASRCLQVADFISHFTWRAAERSQANRIRELDPLWDRFTLGGRARREPFLAFTPPEVRQRFHG